MIGHYSLVLLLLLVFSGCGGPSDSAERASIASPGRAESNVEPALEELLRKYIDAEKARWDVIGAAAIRKAPELKKLIELRVRFRKLLADREAIELMHHLATDPKQISTRTDEEPWVYYELDDEDQKTLERDPEYLKLSDEIDSTVARSRESPDRSKVKELLFGVKSDSVKSAYEKRDEAVRNFALAIEELKQSQSD